MNLNRTTKLHIMSLLPGSFVMILFVYRSSFPTSNGRVFTLFDDAMISMSYAQTLSTTGELVWFPGEQRVQGYTNLLWTLYMSILHFVGLAGSQVALAVSITCMLLLLGTSLLAARLVFKLLSQHQTKALIYSSFVGCSIPFLYPLTFWSLRGMETGFLAFLLMSAVTIAIQSTQNSDGSLKDRKSYFIISLIGALGILTRIDFLLPFSFIILFVAFRRSEVSNSIKKYFAMVLTSTLLILLALFVWQYLYYGDWMPNTYRLKIGGYSIWTRIHRGLMSAGKIAPLLAILSVTHFYLLKTKASESIKLFSSLAVGCTFTISLYSVYVGGDAWEDFGINRYVSISLPLILSAVLINLTFILKQTRITSKKKMFLLVPMMIIFSCLASITTNPFGILFIAVTTYIFIGVISFSFIYFFEIKQSYSEVFKVVVVCLMLISVASAQGIYVMLGSGLLPAYTALDFKKTMQALELKKASLPGAKIAVSWAGAPAYYSSRNMIDLLGKSDRFIAEGFPVTNLPKGTWYEDFYPGHNKYNYEYSIGVLKPDIVVDLLEPMSLSKWGYSVSCLPNGDQIYIKNNSKFINQAALIDCPGT